MRVLLLEVPRLLREILEQTIGAESDCEVLKDSRTLWDGIDQMRSPDMVILGLTAAEDTALVPAIFARWPQAQVLTVMQVGDDAVVYDLKPRRRVLGQVSPAEIVQTLREALRSGEEAQRD